MPEFSADTRSVAYPHPLRVAEPLRSQPAPDRESKCGILYLYFLSRRPGGSGRCRRGLPRAEPNARSIADLNVPDKHGGGRDERGPTAGILPRYSMNIDAPKRSGGRHVIPG
jgi:hypothetical protein